MTREEALDILHHNWTRIDNPNYKEEELDEAFFMAIEALAVANLKEEFGTADTVSREFYEDAVKANIGLVIENRELKEQIESAIPNCQKCAIKELWQATEKEDLVAVVHCKDCRWWQDNNNGYPHANCHWCETETPDEDDFCSCGERRKNDK